MKRILSMLLAAVLVLSLFPVFARADDTETILGMAPIAEGETYQQMTTSRNMIDMIKDVEGFYATPYWDVTQWSIGYGSACGYDYDNKPELELTEEEAEAMLIDNLEMSYAKKVNEYCAKIGKQPSQNQFDALVSFTYNLGTSWMSGTNRLSTWLKNPTTEMELVNAMGVWCRVGGSISYATACRRIREAIVFLHGEYYLAFGNVESDLKRVSNGALPYYKLLIFKADGGTVDGKSTAIRFYKAVESYGSFPEVSYEGHTFDGWVITRVNNNRTTLGNLLTEENTADNHYELTASWTEIPEETVPETTEPEESVPETTEPEQTVPETTEPEPTEPIIGDIELPFDDVNDNAWYLRYVKFVYEYGYMVGTSDTTFGPDMEMTRGMLVQVLYRIAGSPDVDDSQLDCFEDIGGKYYTRAIAWAKTNGIVSGVSDTEFAPDQVVTRQDAICIFYKMYTIAYGLTPREGASLSGFKDQDQVASYAMNQVKWAVAMGMLSGSAEEDGLYISPRGSLTRAQAATILMRFLSHVAGEV